MLPECFSRSRRTYAPRRRFDRAFDPPPRDPANRPRRGLPRHRDTARGCNVGIERVLADASDFVWLLNE